MIVLADDLQKGDIILYGRTQREVLRRYKTTLGRVMIDVRNEVGVTSMVTAVDRRFDVMREVPGAAPTTPPPPPDGHEPPPPAPVDWLVPGAVPIDTQ